MDAEGQAIILGILQGLTEFLPISSSAHLILLPWLLGWRAMGLTFDVMLHAGTLLALLVYFRRQWGELWRQFLNRVKAVFSKSTCRDTQLIDVLLVGTLPALGLGGLFQDVIQHYLRSPVVTVLTLSGFGLLLGWADRRARQTRPLDSLGPREGFLIGMAQALALVPGVSRSGITVTAALFLGLSRADSARFSFLLSTPLVAAAALARGYAWWRLGPSESAWGAPLVLGVVSSFLGGLLCIKYFLRFLATRTYFPFVVYRLLLAGFIWAWARR